MSRSERRSRRSIKLPYHKGNLREKFLREAARMIAEGGTGAVSMRRLSNRLGTSRMAAYHHFANKDHLLAAVGQDGFHRLSERLRASDAGELTTLERLRAALVAYVRFAMEETEFFRLMFAGILQRPLRVDAAGELKPFAFSSREAIAAFGQLLSAVKRCQEEGVIRPGDPLVAANMIHAYVHGVARLAIDDHIKIGCSIEEFLNLGLDALFSGLAPNPNPGTHQ
jgi:AcrR family transcriptional regulator